MRSRVLAHVRPVHGPATDDSELAHDEPPSVEELLRQMDGLDRILRIQNLRREEERAFLESQGVFSNQARRLPPGLWGVALVLLLTPSAAYAADLEQTLRNLVTAFTGRILPILALGYLGKNIFSHVTGDPNAKNESFRVVIAIACLIGLAGVWNFIASQAR